MRSHLALMTLFALFVSIVFSVIAIPKKLRKPRLSAQRQAMPR